MLENIMFQDYYNYEVDYEKYDERMNALAEKDEERWEDMEC